MRQHEHEAGLLLAPSADTYAGFIVWSEEEEHAILRQIFVVPGERGKGYAATLTRFWVERYASRIDDRFGVESANEKSLRLLVKLGYARREGTEIVGEKCFFFTEM